MSFFLGASTPILEVKFYDTQLDLTLRIISIWYACFYRYVFWIEKAMVNLRYSRDWVMTHLKMGCMLILPWSICDILYSLNIVVYACAWIQNRPHKVICHLRTKYKSIKFCKPKIFYGYNQEFKPHQLDKVWRNEVLRLKK